MPLTSTAFEGITEFGPLEILTDTSVTHTSPYPSQALTCTVCQPVGALTGPFICCPEKIAVYVLLSSENPTAVTLCEEHVLESVVKLNGDDTWAPLVGLMTTVCANPGTVNVATIKKKWAKFLTFFIE